MDHSVASMQEGWTLKKKSKCDDAGSNCQGENNAGEGNRKCGLGEETIVYSF